MKDWQIEFEDGAKSLSIEADDVSFTATRKAAIIRRDSYYTRMDLPSLGKIISCRDSQLDTAIILSEDL